MLESLGVSDVEERVYRALLRDPAAALSDLAVAANVNRTRLRRLLSTLETKGLISQSVGRYPNYVPIAPEVGVEGLIQRRQEELELMRTYLLQLRYEYHNSAVMANPVEFVEVVSGQDAVRRSFLQLQQGATETVRIVEKPSESQYEDASAQSIIQLKFQRLREGVQYRAIYSSDALAISGFSEMVLAYTRAGEEARVMPDLPMNLAIADHRLAIMPLLTTASTSQDLSQMESAIIVHQSALLDALATLFEAFWGRALPLSISIEVTRDQEAGRSGEEMALLLALLTAGLTDEAIAQQLGISMRTVRRRIRHLMDHLGVVTRFQAGLQAAKRGWL